MILYSLLIVNLAVLVSCQYEQPQRTLVLNSEGVRPVLRRRHPLQQPREEVIPLRTRGGQRKLPPLVLEQSLQGRPRPALFQEPFPARPLGPTTPSPIPPRPVVEEETEEEDNLPLLAQPSPIPLQSQPTIQPSSLPPFRPAPNDFVQSRHQFRPEPIDDEPPQFTRQPSPQKSQIHRHQDSRPKRPIPIEQRQNISPSRPQKPVIQEETNKRHKKPTAQIIKKYRDDNPDGSITWGFENDDGTFKEETIGIDCITKGRYGYVDPDGVRREYEYTSGMLCDKNKNDSEIEASNEGYIDYTNNKYVFPSGQTIDLDNMVKSRARKPSYKN